MVETLYEYYMDHTEELPGYLREMIGNGTPVHRAVCDHISSMSDRYAIMTCEALFIPRTWDVLEQNREPRPGSTGTCAVSGSGLIIYVLSE